MSSIGYGFRRICWLTIGLLAVLSVAGCDSRTPQEHLDRALGFAAEGDTSSAVIEFKNALQKDPDLGEARLAFGEFYLEVGNLPPALKELERALDLGVDPDRVLPPLLEAKADLGRTQEVLGALEGVDLTPRLRAVRGQALLASGDVDAARADFEAAIEADPAVARAHLGLAMISDSDPDSDLDETASLLKRGVDAVPDNRRLWQSLGEIDLKRQQLDEAQDAFEHARELPGIDFMPELGLARIALLQGDPAQAQRLLDQVISRAPKHPLAQHLRGAIALQNGDLDAAENAFQTALSQNPDYAPSLLALAYVKRVQNQPLQSQSLLERLIAAHPDNVVARKSLAALLLANSDASGALDALRPISAQLTGSDLALLGTTYLRSGNREEASRYFAAAADALPEREDLRRQLAVSLAMAGDEEEALNQLDSVGSGGTDAIESEALKVLLSVRAGDLDTALEAANAMVEQNSAPALAYNVLGVVQIARGDQAAARAAFEQALAANPTFGPAVVNLARMDLAEGKVADARARLEGVLEVDPTDMDVLLALTDMVVAAGDLDRANELLLQAREAHPDSLKPALGLGRLALRRGDSAAAEKASLDAEAIDAESPDVWLLRAQASAVRRDADTVGRYLDKIETYLADSPQIPGSFRLQVADLERQLGRTDSARDNYLALEQSGQLDAAALLGLARVEIAAKRYDAARGYIKRLVDAGADSRVIYELDADIARGTGNVDSAVASYGVAAAAGSREAMTKLAQLQTQQGKFDDAIATLEKWMADHPTDDTTALTLAFTRLQAGDNAGALEDYEALEPRHGDNPYLLNNLAMLYMGEDDPRAEATARKAIAAAPDNPDIKDTLGWILAQSESQTNANEAVELLRDAAAARSDNGTVFYHLAVAQQKAGQNRAAKQSLSRALALGAFPEREEAEALARQLEES